MPIRVGEPLALEDVVEVALGAEVELGSAASGRIGAARDVIERAVSSNETVYGVTTGFGSLANQRIEPDQADTLQLGIVRSHATAVGRPLSREEARAMLLLRAHVLALGHSGVRGEVVERERLPDPDRHGARLRRAPIGGKPRSGRTLIGDVGAVG